MQLPFPVGRFHFPDACGMSDSESANGNGVAAPKGARQLTCCSHHISIPQKGKIKKGAWIRIAGSLLNFSACPMLTSCGHLAKTRHGLKKRNGY